LYIVGRTGFIIGPLRRAGVATLPEFLERRLGNKVRWLAGLFLVVGSILTMSAGLHFGAEFLAACLGLSSDWLPWIIASLVMFALLYTIIGGMISVVGTHFLQSIVLTVGLVAVSVVVISHFGWNRLVTHLWLCWEGTIAGAGQTLHSHPFNPFHSSNFGPARLAWQLLLQIVLATAWQPALSRLLSTCDEKVAPQTYQKLAPFYLARVALPALWGAAALVYFSEQGGLPAGLQDLAPREASLHAVPVFLGSVLPVGLQGLFVAAVLAALLATTSTVLLTSGTVVCNDLILPRRLQATPAPKRLLLIRASVLVLGIIFVAFGVFGRFDSSAWKCVVFAGNLCLGAVFALAVAAVCCPGASSEVRRD
jgi:SSS family solute:Na+ symporter